MRRLRLLIDMDSVMADLSKKWYGLFNAEHEKQLSDSLVRTFDFEGLSKTEKIELMSYLDKDGFFRDLEVIGSAKKVLLALHKEGHEILVVTTPPNITGGNSSVRDKLYWIETNMPFLSPAKHNTIFTSRKGAVLGHLLFDDAPHNIVDFEKAGGLSCAMDYPYNRETPSKFRVFCREWDSFYDIVQRNKDEIFENRGNICFQKE